MASNKVTTMYDKELYSLYSMIIYKQEIVEIYTSKGDIDKTLNWANIL